MNKRAIWVIIVLMGLALIGSIVLQAYWINWSIDLERTRFDQSVFETLNRVAGKLQTLEDMRQEAALFMPELKGSGFSRQFARETESEGESTPAGLLLQDRTNIMVRSIQSNLGVPEMRRLALEKVANSLNPPPLEERIDLEALNQSLEEQLESHGISTAYYYGVFSSKKGTFVIRDGHYVYEDINPKASDLMLKNYLLNTEYKVHLFPGDIESPGMLMIHFPAQARMVWKSVWLPLLASVVFTGIILFSFAYTIQVIFRQKKISEMKTDFINNMTHEFKTPIATISLVADSLESPRVAGDPAKLHRFAEIIRQENRRMHGQVERVLQMAQIEREKMHLRIDRVDMHQLIRQAVDHLNLQVESRHGHIEKFLEASEPVVEGDPNHLANIMHNLLDNANKYSPERPEITVKTKNVPKGLQIKIEDCGIGMTREEKKLIFDKFYRVPTGNLHDVKGFGLGLSYVKAVIEAHHGSVSVKSEPGKGSIFSIFLPFAHQVQS